jgi:hypothetical protein
VLEASSRAEYVHSPHAPPYTCIQPSFTPSFTPLYARPTLVHTGIQPSFTPSVTPLYARPTLVHTCIRTRRQTLLPLVHTLVHTRLHRYVDSPDALALDPGATRLAPAPATSTTTLRAQNSIACACGFLTGVATAAASASRSRPFASTLVASLTCGMGAAIGAALSLRGAAVRDARTLAVVNGGVGSLALAGGLLALPRAAPLSLAFSAHAAYAFVVAAAAEVLTALGWRASLSAKGRGGLWLPRLLVARPATIAGSKPEVGNA